MIGTGLGKRRSVANSSSPPDQNPAKLDQERHSMKLTAALRLHIDQGGIAVPIPASSHSVNSPSSAQLLAPALSLGNSSDPSDNPPSPKRFGQIAKRVFDFTAASLGIAILSPLWGLVALSIWLTNGRPIFYLQERVGQHGRTFRMWKFRSMRNDAERETGPVWASLHDSRCTPIGRFLRKTNIDELPQLWNVVLGNMSLVGPRPERPVFIEKFSKTVPHYDERHEAPCGMTGWAQVHGWRGRTPIEKRIEFDIDYIRRWSFWLDIKILFMTIQHVLYGKTRWD